MTACFKIDRERESEMEKEGDKEKELRRKLMLRVLEH